jgi:hypothetical protein
MVKNWGAAGALIALILLTGFAARLDFLAPYHHCHGPNYCGNYSKNEGKTTDYMVPAFVLGKFLEEHNGAVSAVATGFIAVFTIVLAWRTGGLFKETAGLRDAANKQREDTLRSIAEASRAATAMEDVATHMEATARATMDSVRAAEEATRAAQDQVAIIRTSTVTTERAYVFCERIEAIWSAKHGTENVIKWTFTCVWRNSGKTPTQYGVANVNKWHAINAGDLPLDFPIRTTGRGKEYLLVRTRLCTRRPST